MVDRLEMADAGGSAPRETGNQGRGGGGGGVTFVLIYRHHTCWADYNIVGETQGSNTDCEM